MTIHRKLVFEKKSYCFAKEISVQKYSLKEIKKWSHKWNENNDLKRNEMKGSHKMKNDLKNEKWSQEMKWSQKMKDDPKNEKWSQKMKDDLKKWKTISKNEKMISKSKKVVTKNEKWS